MKSERTYTYSVSTPYKDIYSGSSTSSSASTLYNLALTALGLTSSTYLTILSSGLSVLSAFTSQWGNSFITGSYKDYLQISVTYDDVKQWTYALSGGSWALGLATEKTTVTEIASTQYYWNSSASTGHKVDTCKSTNYTFQSSHYSSPWAYAYQNQFSPVSEWSKWCVGGKTFLF